MHSLNESSSNLSNCHSFSEAPIFRTFDRSQTRNFDCYYLHSDHMINIIEYLTDPFNYTEDAERQRRPTASPIVFLWKSGGPGPWKESVSTKSNVQYVAVFVVMSWLARWQCWASLTPWERRRLTSLSLCLSSSVCKPGTGFIFGRPLVKRFALSWA